MVVRASTRAILTPECYFGRPGRYLYYAFAFERTHADPASADCQKELDALDTLAFATLKCEDLWEKSAYLYVVDWSGAQIASKGLVQIWSAEFDR